MKILNTYAKYLFLAFIAAIMTACGGGTCAPNSNTNPPIIKDLPNSGGAVVEIPVSNLSIPTGSSSTSTVVTLQGGTPGLQIDLSSTVTAQPATQQTHANQDGVNIPISVSFNPESLIAGSVISSDVLVQVTAKLNPGTYYINLYANYKPQGQLLLGTMKIVVGDVSPVPTPTTSPTPIEPGNLSISEESSAIDLGSEHLVTIALNNSTNVTSLAVQINSANTTIVSVTPSSCTLSTSSPSCSIKLAAESAGSSQITATATGYDSVFDNVVVQPLYSYWSDQNVISTVWQCAMDKNGNFANCNSMSKLTSAESQWLPWPTSFNQATNGSTYIYIPNYSIVNGYVTSYEMNSSGQAINESSVLTPSGNTLYSSIVFQTFNGVNYGYVFDGGDNPQRCNLSESGAFVSCVTLQNTTYAGSNTGFYETYSVAFQQVNGTTYGYFTDYDGTSSAGVWICPMTADGLIQGNACNVSTNFENEMSSYNLSPVQIAIKKFSGKLYAYIAAQASILMGSGTSAVTRCEINQTTGALDQPCTELTNSTAPGFTANSVVNIQFKSFSGYDYAYVSDYSGQVWKCTMTLTGEFDGGCDALNNSSQFGTVVGGVFQAFPQ